MGTARIVLAALAIAAAVSAQKPSPTPASAALAPLTAEQLVGLARVGEPALRPDGKMLALTVRRTDLAANKGVATVYVLPVDGGTPTEVGVGSEPQWGPDGSLAFVTAKGIRVLPAPVGGAGGGAALEIAIPDGVGNLSWSPDGEQFAFTQDQKLDPQLRDVYPDLPKANARAYDDLMVRHWDHWREGTYSHLFTVARSGDQPPRDLLAGQRVDTPLPPFGGAEQICWSADGKRLCYTAKKVADPERSTDSGLYVANADGSGRHELLTDGMPGYDQDPAWSPDGRTIAFCSMERAGFEADRLRLMLHDVATGKNRELLAGFDASVHELHWSTDSAQLFFTVETEGTTQLFRAAVADGKPVPVSRGRHALSAIQIAPDASAVYALRTTMERPAEIVRVDVATGAITALTDFNGAVYQQIAMPTVEAEWFPASDGKQIHAWIVKPPGFDPQRRYPLILYCQGGPQSMIGQGFSFRWNFHMMAARGYVVAAVNRRGLPGFGQAWNDQISKDWGGQAMADLLSVCDAMQARPYVDKQRTAAVGASFGGYTVYWLMGNGGDRFACMISHCGVFNLESMYLSTEEQWFVNWDLGGPYWSSPEVEALYRKFSPHRYVQNWKTPLLVIHGEKDFRVPYDQGLQAFTAAQMQGCTSRLLEFPDEGHWVLQPQNGVLWQREFFAWLDRFCQKEVGR